MLERIFPRQLDNEYRGYRVALVIFGLIIAVRALQSVMVIFNGPATVTGADGIPLGSYPADAAQTVLGLFAQNSLWRLVFSMIGVVVLVRYRTAVPLMFAAMILTFVGAQVLSIYMPLARVGPVPTGLIVNRVMVGLMLVGLVLSVLKRRGIHP
ncbi:MAG TPA: hypothetical protein VNA17_04080 [Pyrinomonadaceae bacterium]|nr:hypothetical protein [Pyrinomonadaceae bacterium]